MQAQLDVARKAAKAAEVDAKRKAAQEAKDADAASKLAEEIKQKKERAEARARSDLVFEKRAVRTGPCLPPAVASRRENAR